MFSFDHCDLAELNTQGALWGCSGLVLHREMETARKSPHRKELLSGPGVAGQ